MKGSETAHHLPLLTYTICIRHCSSPAVVDMYHAYEIHTPEHQRADCARAPAHQWVRGKGDEGMIARTRKLTLGGGGGSAGRRGGPVPAPDVHAAGLGAEPQHRVRGHASRQSCSRQALVSLLNVTKSRRALRGPCDSPTLYTLYTAHHHGRTPKAAAG